MKKTFLTLLIIWFAGNMANSQTPLTPEKLWELGRVGTPAVDTKQENIYYTVKHYDLAKNKGQEQVYTTNLKTKAIKKITDIEGGIGNIIINPVSGKIGYVHKGQLWEMNPDGTAAEQTTKFENKISNVKYSPSGDKILFTYSLSIGEGKSHDDLPESNFKLYNDLMFRHWSSWNDNTHSHAAYASISDAKNGKGKLL